MKTLKVARNARQKMDGLALLRGLGDRSVAMVNFDPQYRSVLDAQQYGNEGERQSARADLPQMPDAMIAEFIVEIGRVLQSSGHMTLWLDKFMLVSGKWHQWMPEITPMREVDALIWDKENIGMGRRFRSRFEALILIQKGPVRAEGVWKNHSMPDVARAKPERTRHPHAKPVPVMQAIIESCTNPGDVVVDPCAGGYGVLDACRASGRVFIGCDLL